MNRVAIRVDASEVIGSGHVRRCLSLAQALTEMGALVRFVCRPLDTVALQMLARRSADVHWLPAARTRLVAAFGSQTPPHAAWAGVASLRDVHDTAQALSGWKPDWMVVDHYAFDAEWHQAIQHALGCRLLVIDDTADRSLYADVLLDQNWSPNHLRKYAHRLRNEPRWLCGPRFALLAADYQHAARYVFHEVVRSIGIFMGATDPDGASARALRACRAAGFTGLIEVVSTTDSPYLNALRQACATDPATILTLDLPGLAAFFARHDLHIGAGGGATWERCCIGAPSVAIALASNQLAVVPGLASIGAVRAADDQTLPAVLRELIGDPTTRLTLATRAAALVDGRGAQRVGLALLRDFIELRPATMNDAQLLYRWRNHPAVRAVSATQEPIQYDTHEKWLSALLTRDERMLFVAQVGSLPVGSIRFDLRDDGHFEVSLYLDPDLQGLGVGRRLLVAGEQALLARYAEGFTVDANVQPDNIPSQRIFEVSGYHGGPLQYRKSIRPAPEHQKSLI